MIRNICPELRPVADGLFLSLELIALTQRLLSREL